MSTVLVSERLVAAFFLIAPIGRVDRFTPVVFRVRKMLGENERHALDFTRFQREVGRERGILGCFVFGSTRGRIRKAAASEKLIPPFLKFIPPLAMCPLQ